MAFSFVFISFHFLLLLLLQRSTKIPNIRANMARVAPRASNETHRSIFKLFGISGTWPCGIRSLNIVIVGVSWKMCARLFWYVLHILFRIKSSSPLHIRNEWSCIYLAGECARWSYAPTLLLLYFVPTSTQMKNDFKMHCTWVLKTWRCGTVGGHSFISSLVHCSIRRTSR